MCIPTVIDDIMIDMVNEANNFLIHLQFLYIGLIRTDLGKPAEASDDFRQP